MAEIQLQGIRKRFRDVVVVDNLDLTIHDQEFFTFVGPSGCGKSTILSLIAGLEPVSEGTIRLDSEPINHLSPGQRDVAMVFQSYALYPHMSVYENIGFPLTVRKMPKEKIDAAVNEVAAVLGLEQLLQRKPRQLSGGQRQRVALGRALVRRPKAFLMDEPLSNLDARLRVDMRAELKRLHNEFKITTIYVTHDQEEALVLSNRVAVLNQGKIQQLGPPLELYDRPANRFVAEFIGSPPMNLLDGKFFEGLPFLQSESLDEIVIGIRPSDVLVRKEGGPNSLPAKVIVVEPTGNDSWVLGDWKGVRIKGKANPGDAFQPGSTAFFEFDPAKIHRFDKGSGKRVESIESVES